MITFLFILLLLFIFSNYLFTRLRNYLNLMSLTAGWILLLNDFYSTAVPDSTLKLAFMLMFALYTYIVWYHINYVWVKELK